MVVMHGARRSRAGALAAWLVAAAALGAGGVARGSAVLALELPELTARADRIVVAEVLSVTSAWDAGRKQIHSTVELGVSESWKGDLPRTRRLVLVQPGGSVDELEMKVHGLPSFAAGERAVLFLRGRGAEPLALVGLGQGKRPLRFDSAGRRWMVDGGDRSAAVRIEPGGRLVPVAPEVALPLEELRRRVHALVKRP